MSPRKVTVVRNPKLRRVIAWGLLLIPILVALTFLPDNIGWVIILIIGIVVGGIYGVIMLISTIMAVVYWAKTGDLYTPWAMSPWGKGPLGGARE